MRDVKYDLRKAYITALASLTDIDGADVPVWYLECPETDTSNVFVIISPVDSVGNGTKSSHDLDTAMQVEVHNWNDYANSGANTDYVVGKILEAIMPAPGQNIPCDSYIVHTRLTNDATQDMGSIGGRKYVRRVLRFEHHIQS